MRKTVTSGLKDWWAEKTNTCIFIFMATPYKCFSIHVLVFTVESS